MFVLLNAIPFTFDFNLNTGGVKIGKMDLNLFDGLAKVAKIIAILVAMYLIIKIGKAIIDKFIEKQIKSDLKFTLDEKKSKTLGAVLKSILRYSVYFFGIVAILTEIFGTVSLTFASIGGVAIGFGAQSIIKDVINGFFILLEDQFAVGDYINIDDKGGIVESIELRITKIRDFNGDLYLIPNGLIAKVTNHSRGAMRILVDVSIAYEEDIDHAIEIINKACTKFIEGNLDVIDPPKVLGVTSFGASGVNLRVAGKVKPMTQWNNENNLRKLIKNALDSEKIEIPYNKIQLVEEEKNA